MQKTAIYFLSSLLMVLQTTIFAGVAEFSAKSESNSNMSIKDSKNGLQNNFFRSFTGKITRNKVRMRLQPSLDGQILRELNKDDLLIVVGDNDDFYAVRPPAETKGYIYRTYVLDNVVEGNNVNVRLEPALEAPVIAQLNSGDRVRGSVSALNSKWMEITPPNTTQFYVCKEYVDNIGDANMMSLIEKRRDEANTLLNSAYLTSQSELQKSYLDMRLESVNDKLNAIITNYSDFPNQALRAKELLLSIQEQQIKKKISYLELKANSLDELDAKNSQLISEIQSQQRQLDILEEQSRNAKMNDIYAQDNNVNYQIQPENTYQTMHSSNITDKMTAWIPAEQVLYEAWTQQNNHLSFEDYYEMQRKRPIELVGILEPYNRAVKNKPGDYVLVNKKNHLPIAYLYSTQINLQESLGQELTVLVSPRPNNNFAFPAYFVLGIR